MIAGRLKIISQLRIPRFAIGVCALWCLLVSCIGPVAPEKVAAELSGGYAIVATLPTTGYAQGVVVADSFAYIAQGQCGIAIVNIADPRHPRLIAEELFYTIPGYIKGYSKNVAYLKDSSGAEILYCANGAAGVASLDITDKRRPTVLRPAAPFKPAMDLFVFRNFLFCSDSTQGIGIGDLSDPKYPQGLAALSLPGYSKGACVSPDSVYLLCAIGEVGFVMENISRLATDMEIPAAHAGRLNLPGVAENIAIKPGTRYAFLACGPTGLHIVDYSDTAHIRLAGAFATGGYAKEVCVTGNTAYLATERRGVQIIDIANVASPQRIGIIATNDARGIAVSNGYLYVADQEEGLVIIKIP
jgi:hypothetical protein